MLDKIIIGITALMGILTQPVNINFPAGVTVPVKEEAVTQAQKWEDLKYPDSVLVSMTEDKWILESNQTPEVITDWYKDKIQALDLNIKSFALIKVNGRVLNRLVGKNDSRELIVEVSDEENEKVVITINNGDYTPTIKGVAK